MAHNAQEALKELASDLNLTLAFNSDNVCDLEVGDAEVTLEGDPEGTQLRINGVVGSLPDPDNVEGLKLLLQANFNGQGVGQSRLGMDHVSQEIVLGRSLDVSRLPLNGLTAELEEFINYLSFWRKHLQQTVDLSGGSHASPAPAMRV